MKQIQSLDGPHFAFDAVNFSICIGLAGYSKEADHLEYILYFNPTCIVRVYITMVVFLSFKDCFY